MMTVPQILKMLDPKNQNLPKVEANSSTKDYDLMIVPVFEETMKETLKLDKSLASLKLTGKKGEVHHVPVNGQLWKLVGLGKLSKMDAREVRRFYGKCYLEAEKMNVKKAGILVPELDWVTMATVGVLVASLSPDVFKKPGKKRDNVPTIALVNKDFTKKAAVVKKMMKEGEVTAEAKNLMRILGALPPNILNTDSYSEVIVKLCKKWGVKCKNIAKKDLTKYELLNSVSLGSARDSKLLWITLPVKGSKKASIVVGKGLCYDSGGMQGKGSHMNSMKEDMGGSASCMGTILNITKNKLKLKETTHFLLPLAENMMGGAANRADDIWTAGDGQLVEIKHTDAEGRLVMGDAICYAKNNVKEKIDKVFTIATLTGSCVSALGEVYTGNLCNDDELREEAVAAGKTSGDYVFSGPWNQEYNDDITPTLADVANLANKAREAGWIKAGFYLSRFVPKDKKTGELTAKFCHFDIAGSIDMYEKGNSHRRKGFNSGVGVGYLSLLLTK